MKRTLEELMLATRMWLERIVTGDQQINGIWVVDLINDLVEAYFTEQEAGHE